MKRWNNGDAKVKSVMASYGALVEKGLNALLAGNITQLADCMDRNFELRASIFPIDNQDQKMIDLCRRHGSAAKLCGSGGAVLALMKAENEWSSLEDEAKEMGIEVIALKLLKEVP